MQVFACGLHLETLSHHHALSEQVHEGLLARHLPLRVQEVTEEPRVVQVHDGWKVKGHFLVKDWSWQSLQIDKSVQDEYRSTCYYIAGQQYDLYMPTIVKLKRQVYTSCFVTNKCNLG